eukprot:2601466-Amphidinium_carterae.1
MSRAAQKDEVGIMVLDFASAFYQVPLHPDERRYFCAKVRETYFVYKRLAQGSRLAPLVWARVAALVMRLTCSLLQADAAAAECFVEDPLIVVNGTLAAQKIELSLVLLAWHALGVQLSTHKAQLGTRIKWIGFVLEARDGMVCATMKDEIYKDIVDL